MSSTSNSRRSLFAVWHWPRWVWGIGITTAALSYILAYPVLFFFIMTHRGNPPPVSDWAFDALWMFFFPALWSADNLPLLERIWEWEYSFLEYLFGTTEGL
jgi:hypothetical protein